MMPLAAYTLAELTKMIHTLDYAKKPDPRIRAGVIAELNRRGVPVK